MAAAVHAFLDGPSPSAHGALRAVPGRQASAQPALAQRAMAQREADGALYEPSRALECVKAALADINALLAEHRDAFHHAEQPASGWRPLSASDGPLARPTFP